MNLPLIDFLTMNQDEKHKEQIATEFLQYLNEDTKEIAPILNKEVGNDKNVLLDSQTVMLSQTDFKNFNLPESIKNSLYNLGFDKLSKNQIKSIPEIQNGKSMMYKSDSGTGKTISFVVGTLSQIIGNDGNLVEKSGMFPKIVVISPTIELNQQIANVFESVGSPAVSVKLTKRGERINFLRSDVLIGSPHSIANTLRSLRIKNVKTLIIDEADVVLDPENMGTMTAQILRNVKFEQYLFFSATYSEDIRKLILQSCPDIIDQSNTAQTIPDGIKLYHIETPQQTQNNSEQSKQKEEILNTLFTVLNIGQAIIFVNTKRKAGILSEFFRSDLHKVSVLHGDLDVNERNSISNEFRRGETRILITTDLFSRGIDIPAVNLVINYDLPVNFNKVDVSTYIHRIGRCGRFGRRGFVIDFVSSSDDLYILDTIKQSIGKESQKLDLHALENVAGRLLMQEGSIGTSTASLSPSGWQQD